MVRTAFGCLLATVAAVAAVAATIMPSAAAAASHHPPPPLHRQVSVTDYSRPVDLPADAPPALYAPEPKLPAADGWPGSNAAFSRTSGTGRLADGGLYWTDWLYDDHGTTTASPGDLSVTAGSPSFGLYTYPPGAAHGNGADIFTAAVLDRPGATYWRVDWNTLADPSVPVAEWTFDRDDDAATGGSAWPAGAGVHSPGIDTALTMSSHGAQLISVGSGKVLATFPVTVDGAAQSFVVRIPKSVLDPTGSWRIRLAAGLADAAGTSFARPPDALPTEPAVYNVTFRRIDQEKIAANFWDDQAQTLALLTGNVSAFSHVVHWSLLARHTRTSPPRPTGWSDRWYVSAVSLGQGIVTGASTILDNQANYLGRVQPYAVYVPKSYRPGRPTPLTFLLHSLTQNHNQYAATTPNFSRLACEDRHSICVTTLGRGPDGDYFDYAELDFWQVWHAVAAAYDVDPDRTLLCGYSMGGLGTNQLAMAHPDLFAKAVTLAGAVGNVPALHNLRWIPTYLAGGVTDELVPLPIEMAEANGLAALGDRYRWVIYPAVDHVAFELADAFADAAKYMGDAERVRDPGRFSFTWYPANGGGLSGNQLTGGGISWTQLPQYGVGTTGDYWVRDLTARSRQRYATVKAYSGVRPERSVATHSAHNITVDGPGPGVASQLTWTRGRRPAAKPLITLRLTNVRRLVVLLRAAGFHQGQAGTLRVVTDGPTTLGLDRRVLRLHKGTKTVRFTA
ncbi:MAG TPA: prolyl oligopeptidase family serine peptidase [Mycobacteriales bacterium]|nr:prolyl oligopeptidase family serine peptidase [Mycobacteriales bacterium]